ncbi:hypothetical protein GCM10007904_44610 [Oharaeibacter diazotrophicus]|nr:hypothetical protein GCM10007904_44610 [Oharaeibacter diazotrophicus]
MTAPPIDTIRSAAAAGRAATTARARAAARAGARKGRGGIEASPDGAAPAEGRPVARFGTVPMLRGVRNK